MPVSAELLPPHTTQLVDERTSRDALGRLLDTLPFAPLATAATDTVAEADEPLVAHSRVVLEPRQSVTPLMEEHPQLAVLVEEVPHETLTGDKTIPRGEREGRRVDFEKRILAISKEEAKEVFRGKRAGANPGATQGGTPYLQPRQDIAVVSRADLGIPSDFIVKRGEGSTRFLSARPREQRPLQPGTRRRTPRI
jgi:hypothetical protein